MSRFRYAQWDGTQDWSSLDADDLMAELERHLMSYGDLSYALKLMQRGGITGSQGQRLPGIQDLLQRLRQQRREQLEKFQLSSVLDEIRQKLDNILKTERDGIQKKLAEARQKAGDSGGALSPEMQQKLRQTIEDMAAQNLKKLAELPADIGGQVGALAKYDFMDEEARRQFAELMDMLKKQAMSSYARDLVQQFQGMDAPALSRIRHLVEAINQMLEQRRRGEEPDFNQFLAQFGDSFGPQPPRRLDELIARLQSQIAQAQSLLESLSAADRQSLENLLNSMFDDSTRYELAKMAANLEALSPSERLRQRYPFSGEEPISYSEALKLMERLQKMDQLEGQLSDSQQNQSLDAIDEKLLKELLGDPAAGELDHLRQITKLLEEAGYIRGQEGKYELTPRGMRKIGQKALQDIFAQLRKDRMGGHNMKLRGGGGERIEETKKYQFGDDFALDLPKTLMNALYRAPQAPPLQLSVDDFEISQTEGLTQTAIILILDLSLSMFMRGNFQAAKRVAIALDSLIRSQYPKDSLQIVGFSQYARLIKKEDLLRINRNRFEHGTNLQQALILARKLLSKERSNNKQIILISDGEPTAHMEGNDVYFQYPPSLRTLSLTLREVRNCTQNHIVINTFMFDDSPFLSNFVTQMACLNRGRVFFTNADELGKYVLVDYVAGKKKRLW